MELRWSPPAGCIGNRKEKKDLNFFNYETREKYEKNAQKLLVSKLSNFRVFSAFRS